MTDINKTFFHGEHTDVRKNPQISLIIRLRVMIRVDFVLVLRKVWISNNDSRPRLWWGCRIHWAHWMNRCCISHIATGIWEMFCAIDVIVDDHDFRFDQFVIDEIRQKWIKFWCSFGQWHFCVGLKFNVYQLVLLRNLITEDMRTHLYTRLWSYRMVAHNHNLQRPLGLNYQSSNKSNGAYEGTSTWALDIRTQSCDAWWMLPHPQTHNSNLHTTKGFGRIYIFMLHTVWAIIYAANFLKLAFYKQVYILAMLYK